MGGSHSVGLSPPKLQVYKALLKHRLQKLCQRCFPRILGALGDPRSFGLLRLAFNECILFCLSLLPSGHCFCLAWWGTFLDQLEAFASTLTWTEAEIGSNCFKSIYSATGTYLQAAVPDVPAQQIREALADGCFQQHRTAGTSSYPRISERF